MNTARTLSSIVLSCLMLSQTAIAQDDVMHGAGSESVTLKVGDIFEILPVHDLPTDSAYTWILTQDRTFLEATRAPLFRKRFIQPGTYTLFADIVSPDGSRRLTRTFTIDYQARQPGETMTQTGVGGSGMLVTTTPAMDSMGRTALSAGTQLIRLNPVNPDITPLALDLDLNRDANNDGSNDNDIQGNETFFASDATPLYLWIADEPLTRHPISVTASLPDGARVQNIEILEESLARSEGVVQGPVMISAEKTSNRTYQFTAVFQGEAPAGGQLLYQWQFGDGQQSLVNAPSHDYADDGDYTVQLLIRNLRDGKEMANTSTTVNVSGTGETPSSEPSQASSKNNEEPNDSAGSTSSLRSILLFVGIFIGSLVIGAIVMTLFSFMRRNKGSIAQKIEALEQAVVKPVESTPALTITPPASAPSASKPPVQPQQPKPAPTPAPQTPPPEVAKREEERATSNPVTQPAQTVNAKASPAWLQPAPKPATPAPVQPAAQPVVPPAPKPAPVPAPQQPKPQPTPQAPKQPTPAPSVPQQPKPQVPSTPQQQNRPQATPAWLQQPPATPAPAVEAPRPVVPQQPQTPPTPKPVVPPAALPQTPKPTPAPVVPPIASAPVATPAPAPVQPTSPITPPAPKPVEAVVPVTPVVPPVAQQPQKPVDLPIPQEIPSTGDQPIAIIRAESLNKENQQNG